AGQTIAPGWNRTFDAGQPPTAISAITVTDAATATIKKGKDIRVRIPATFNMTWNTALTTATITGTAASKVSTTVTYEDGGKTLVLDVTTDFAAGDQIIVSGLQYTSFATPSGADCLQLVVTGAGRVTTATITGVAASKVLPIVSYEDGGKTLVLDVAIDFAAGDQIVVDGLQYQNFTAPSAADYLQLVVTGAGSVTNASDSRSIQIVAPTMASAVNQSFVVAQPPTAISAITVTDAATPTVTAAGDLR